MLRSTKYVGRNLVMWVALCAVLVPAMAAASSATSVIAGQRHTCAVTSSGAIKCWGWNIYGALGDGTTTDSLVPVQVIGLTSGVTATAAGPYHTCSVTTGGAVFCWGGNQFGQLGDGTTVPAFRPTPAPVNGLASGVVALTAGYYHTCALTSGGAVACWGANFNGRLGDGTTTDRLTPVPVSGLTSGVVAVAAGAHHTCAVTGGGAVVCWGANFNGQLGDATTTDRLTPVAVSGLASGVASVATGLYHSCAVTTGGAMQCWGNNSSGQLGDGTTVPAFRSTPAPVTGLGSGVASIAAGEGHTCALLATGAVLCWGRNANGQVGDATTTDRATPVPVTGLPSAAGAITAGQWHTCALTTAGAVQCWGYNQSGGLGDGTTSERHTPVTASGFDGAQIVIATVSLPAGKVAGDYLHALAATGGTLPYTWTRSSGTLPPGVTLSPQGLLSGRFLLAGTYSFRVRATGADAAWAEADLTLTVDLFRRYFAEGGADAFFDCYFALANPGSTTANVSLSFLRSDLQVFAQALQVPPLTRRTLDVKTVAGMSVAPAFATILESDVEVVADRTMTWDATGYGSHAESAIKEPAYTWYLAEGATQNGLQLYYLIANPNPGPVDVTVTYLRRSPNPPVTIVYPAIPGYSRTTIYVNGEDTRLAWGDVSGMVTSTGGPIVVERSLYLNNENRQFNGGHASAGVTSLATDWFLAEGATVWNFDMFILLANPGSTSGTATITYMLTDGRTMVKHYPVAAESRLTVWVNGERDDVNPGFTLQRVSLSAMVHSTVPIIVERAMWWSAVPQGTWVEAHNSAATTETGTMWGVADGEQGGSRSADTYIVVANTSPFPGRVRVAALCEDGSTPWTELDMPANSRSTFWMGGMTVTADSPFGAALAGKKFGVVVESLLTAGGTAAIVVERAMYSNWGGLQWVAGTDVVAAKLK